MTEIEIQTSLLYGIFVSAKSFLVGTRFLVNQARTRFLVNRILRHRLPQELIDLIGDQLHLMNQADILARWKANPAEEIFYDFLSTPAMRHGARPPRHPAEWAVLGRMRKYGNVNTIWVTVSRPGSTASGEPHDGKMYLHLSASRSDRKPSLAWSLPPGGNSTSLTTTGAVYIGRKGKTACGLNPGQNASNGLAIDAAVYLRNPGNSNRKRRRGLPEVQAARLLQCENITDVIRDWDAEAVKAYVEALGLKVVPFDGEVGDGDAMKPGLHIWQRICDCVDG